MRRTEEGKSLRKAYESHTSDRERERRNSQSTSQLTNQEKSTKQIALWQDKIEESQTTNRLVPVLLSKQATKFERIIEICGTLMARDYKGFGNQDMCGVITYEDKHK